MEVDMETKTYGERLDEMTRKHMAQNPEMDYRAAMLAVIEANPDISKEYASECRKPKPKPERPDPMEDHKYDCEAVKKKKARVRAGAELDRQAKTYVLLRGLPYPDAFRLAMLERRDLVKTYLDE